MTLQLLQHGQFYSFCEKKNPFNDILIMMLLWFEYGWGWGSVSQHELLEIECSLKFESSFSTFCYTSSFKTSYLRTKEVLFLSSLESFWKTMMNKL